MGSIRVLHCNIDNKNLGGAYLLERRIEPYMRKLGFIYDYITMDEFVKTENEEINPLQGTKTYSAHLRDNRFIGHIRFPKYISYVLSKNQYKIVHINIDSAWKALIYAVPAKKSGAKVIIHSHSTGIDGGYKTIKYLLHLIGKKVLVKYTDKYIGCSEEANKWLVPKKKLKQAVVLKNGVDTKQYYRDYVIRKKSRAELNFKDDELVIGNVARINDNKNQIFLVKILRKMLDKGVNVKLLLVGAYTKKAYDKVYEMAMKLNVESYVIFTGETSMVNNYLNTMDYFVFPSIFEGFPLSVIEAQAVGLKCLISSTISSEVIETGLVTKMSLDEGEEKWADFISKDNCLISSCHASNEEIYSLEKMASDMKGLYKEVLYGFYVKNKK